MTRKRLAFLALALLALRPLVQAVAQGMQPHDASIVRLAELEIDPAQLTAYTAALREEIEASIRLEPGVLALYAVAVKDHPNQVRLFEQYSSPAAYQAHLQTPHFLKYKAVTQGMVRSLRLTETNPILLGAKPRNR